MTKIRRFSVFFLGFLILLGLLFAAYVWVTLHWTYSEGQRAGYVQKFSKRGWVCKTWEGELLLTTLPGVVPEKFEFTVRDDALADQLAAATGKRVIMSYSQHKGIPGSCFGDTEYFIEKLQIAP